MVNFKSPSMEKDAMPGDNRECANLKNLDPLISMQLHW